MCVCVRARFYCTFETFTYATQIINIRFPVRAHETKMAAPWEEDGVYFVVNNIPVKFRSADLRNYFSQFIESGGFLCFHYRHRPEVRINTAETENAQRQTQKRTEEEEGKDEEEEEEGGGGGGEEEEEDRKSEVRAEATCCCVVRVKGGEAQRFVNMYSGNQWIDSKGNWLIKRCLIRRIKVSDHSGEAPSGLYLQPFTLFLFH